MSRIGNKPIPLPSGVKIAVAADKIDVQGPKGKMSVAVPHGISFEQKDGVLNVKRATDEHRALNYLAVRYQAIYAGAADAFARNASLSSVDVQPSPLSGTRKVVDVIFTYTNRNTDVDEKSFARVDVTEEFPYLVTKLSPYYDTQS